MIQHISAVTFAVRAMPEAIAFYTKLGFTLVYGGPAARIKPTGRLYRQEYVVFLRAAGGKIAFLREYFNPVEAAKAMDAPILGLAS